MLILDYQIFACLNMCFYCIRDNNNNKKSIEEINNNMAMFFNKISMFLDLEIVVKSNTLILPYSSDDFKRLANWHLATFGLFFSDFIYNKERNKSEEDHEDFKKLIKFKIIDISKHYGDIE